MSIKERVEALKEIVSAIEQDLIKFEQGNSAAGTRARGQCQSAKVAIGEIRTAVQAEKQARAEKKDAK